jgi:hypothetical protein
MGVVGRATGTMGGSPEAGHDVRWDKNATVMVHFTWTFHLHPMCAMTAGVLLTLVIAQAEQMDKVVPS